MERSEALDVLCNVISGQAENIAEDGKSFNRMIDRGRQALQVWGIDDGGRLDF